jgi:hypothetical protein
MMRRQERTTKNKRDGRKKKRIFNPIFFIMVANSLQNIKIVLTANTIKKA